jgi:WhiB family redox-sensing transcriptional regulator
MKPRRSYDPNFSSALLAMHSATDLAEAAERREAALKITDMAADSHLCELDPDSGADVCTHPDHDRDADWARVALDVLGLDDLTGNDEEEPEFVPNRARLSRSSFTQPEWGWQDAAACQGEDLLLFFGPDGERQPEREIRERKAKRICRACPVRTECLNHALAAPERFGVWGGQNEDDRHREHRRRVERERRKKDAA